MSTVNTPIKKGIKINKPISRLAEMPVFKSIAFTDENIAFHLSDNRIVTIPMHWVPKLEKASKTTRENYILRGHFVFWEEVDEIIGVKNLLNGTIVPQ
ncbi:MAG: DUF2442 domain-containing protein [Bacteroidota bacterium]|nr:DUF2442 domain-containing protein [Bacteroidota bacterium]